MTDREHIQTLLTVAKRYWLEQATQAEIAAEIGYSMKRGAAESSRLPCSTRYNEQLSWNRT